jgi:glycosyltransferase involved in cell wall biosynthesis
VQISYDFVDRSGWREETSRIVLDSLGGKLSMKILQVCSAREFGGGEKHLADLANALVARGHDVYAAIVPSSPLLAELSSVLKQNIIELPMRNALSVGSAFRLARFVRQHRIEIIHAHVARDYPLAALAAQRSGARLVLTRHVLFPLNRIHRLTLRQTARVIAVSQAVKDSLMRQGVFDQEKLICIHNGIDVELFVKGREVVAGQKQDRERPLRVGMVGHLAPIKGQDDFVRAAAIVREERKDVEFIIAGEDKSRTGENRTNLERLIGELKLSQCVRLLGWVADVAQLIPSFDLFVSPARSEPFGLSIVEAMAGGAPVLATMSEGAREIVEDRQNGRLVPVGDVEALAATMLELLDDSKERDRLSANALSTVRERFAQEQMVRATEQVYLEAIGRRGA